jgi:hypothetical protein
MNALSGRGLAAKEAMTKTRSPDRWTVGSEASVGYGGLSFRSPVTLALVRPNNSCTAPLERVPAASFRSHIVERVAAPCNFYPTVRKGFLALYSTGSTGSRSFANNSSHLPANASQISSPSQITMLG